MKQGRSLQELASELSRQKDLKRDFIASTVNLEMFQAGSTLEVALKNRDETPNFFLPTPHAHAQIATRLKMPKTWYDYLKNEHPSMLANDVTELWLRNPKTSLVRTMGTDMRALLSDRYRALDNYDLAEIALPALEKTGCKVQSCEITETKMYIKAVSPRLTGDIKLNDPVQQGIVISNSEVGDGALRIESLIYRLVCLNGMIAGSSVRKAHLGRRNPIGDMMEQQHYLRDSTKKLDDAAFWAKTKDAIDYVLSEAHLESALGEMRIASELQVDAPPQKTIEVLSKRLNLSEKEGGGVLQHLISGGDLTAWGYTNAITRMSQDVDDYSRATEIERAGGKVVELTRLDWQAIVAEASK